MIVRRLGGVYFGSKTPSNFLNPVSSTKLMGCRSVTIMFKRASLILARRTESPVKIVEYIIIQCFSV